MAELAGLAGLAPPLDGPAAPRDGLPHCLTAEALVLRSHILPDIWNKNEVLKLIYATFFVPSVNPFLRWKAK